MTRRQPYLPPKHESSLAFEVLDVVRYDSADKMLGLLIGGSCALAGFLVGVGFAAFSLTGSIF